jgi:hypothetical protein
LRLAADSWSLDKKGEFYIDIVSTEGEEKDFKAKRSISRACLEVVSIPSIRRPSTEDSFLTLI